MSNAASLPHTLPLGERVILALSAAAQHDSTVLRHPLAHPGYYSLYQQLVKDWVWLKEYAESLGRLNQK